MDRDISKIRKVLNSAYHEEQAVENRRTFRLPASKGYIVPVVGGGGGYFTFALPFHIFNNNNNKSFIFLTLL